MGFNVVSKNTEEKLKQFGCNPLQLSAQIANGTGVVLEHPEFQAIKNIWLKVLMSLHDDRLDIPLLNTFWAKTQDALKYSPPSQDLRSKHILSLTKHVAPLLSSISQINAEVDVTNLDTIPDEILEQIAKGEIDVSSP